MSEKSFSHLDENSNPAMVDVSEKSLTKRTATAQSIVVLTPEIMNLMVDGDIKTKKGAVFQTAIIAGTMGAKRTSDLIPLCHQLGLDGCKFEIETAGIEVIINCTCTLTAKTGVEMEALVGASIAALTIYDMCKVFSHDIVIKETKLIEKMGGKSDYTSP
jgi:cyclic pyranopterin monophosphate synthase